MRMVVGDITHHGNRAVHQSAERGGSRWRLAKREATRRTRPALLGRHTRSNRALDVQQNEIGAGEKWLECRRNTIRSRAKSELRPERVGRISRPFRIEIRTQGDVPAR